MVKEHPLALAVLLACLLCGGQTACAATGQNGPALQQGQLLRQGSYPYHQCRSPLRPLAGDSKSDWLFYRQEMLDYRRCVETYLAQARADMSLIREQMDKAVREYNEVSGNR